MTAPASVCPKTKIGHRYDTGPNVRELICLDCQHVYEPPPIQEKEKADPSKIQHHEGRKYLRTIHSAVNPAISIQVDVYAILEAYKVTCPATAHALKKVLMAGERNKGSRLADLQGAVDALYRAIELEKQRQEGK